MLADSPRSLGLGSLASGVHQPGTFLLRLVQFIADHLPQWRDHPDRPALQSEGDLTAQLGNYLNGAARRSMDIVQFMTEVPDSVQRGRDIDIAVQPCGVTIHVEGRSYTQFQTLLPIECKRLPTPASSGRDEREYVATSGGTTGGIQRFKLGAHGAAHDMALMIGYLQEGTASSWLRRINQWLLEVGRDDPCWTGEHLVPVDAMSASVDSVQRFRSSHLRQHGQSRIELCHLWIAMLSRARIDVGSA